MDDDEGGDYYGYRVAIDGDTALVTATRRGDYSQRLFVFQRSSSVWVQEAMLHVNEDFAHDDVLRVAIEGDTGKKPN